MIYLTGLFGHGQMAAYTKPATTKPPLISYLIFLSPRRVSPFLAWGDFHARSRFARSIIPEEKWGTTRSLPAAESNSQNKQFPGAIDISGLRDTVKTVFFSQNQFNLDCRAYFKF